MPGNRQQRVGVLEADPDLGRWLRPIDFVEADRRTVVPVLVLAPGVWEPPEQPASPGHLGYLVLEGLLAREEEIAGSTSTELLGPGELLQPWNNQPDEMLLSRAVEWEALEPTRLAVLGPSFVEAIAPWPPLMTALLDRSMRCAARVATHRAICQLSPVDFRLHVLFWHLAERWGHVGADSVVLPVPLRHETLGRLAAAKRPTVTLALQKLAVSDLVHRRDDGAWMLHGRAPTAAPANNHRPREPVAEGPAPAFAFARAMLRRNPARSIQD